MSNSNTMFKVISRIAIMLILSCLIAIIVNLLRKDAIPFVAKVEYDIYQDCPEIEFESKAIGIEEFVKKSPKFNIIDSRSADKFKIMHIPSAINIPYNPLFAPKKKYLDMIDKAKPVIVYDDDASDKRAEFLVSDLKQSGIKNAVFLEGGLEKWLAFSKKGICK